MASSIGPSVYAGVTGVGHRRGRCVERLLHACTSDSIGSVKRLSGLRSARPTAGAEGIWHMQAVMPRPLAKYPPPADRSTPSALLSSGEIFAVNPRRTTEP